MKKQGQNNQVEVGDNNSGNIAGGDINITQHFTKRIFKKPFTLKKRNKIRWMLKFKDNKIYQKHIHFRLTEYAKKYFGTGKFIDLADDQFQIIWEQWKIYVKAFLFVPLTLILLTLVALFLFL